MTNSSVLTIAALLSIPIACLTVCGILALIPPPPPPEEEAQPSWSPDGQRLAYVCYLEGPTEGWTLFEIVSNLTPPSPDAPYSEFTAEAADICVIDIDGRNRKRLTQEPGEEWGPVWSPDGTRIAYLRRDGIYVINADGHNQRRLVSGRVTYAERIAWSPNGSQLLFSACLDKLKLDSDVYLANVDNGAITNLTRDSYRLDISPRWISNGTKIFFLSAVLPTRGNPLNCDLRGNASQMKIINADGSGERTIYKELYYPVVSVSSNGQVAFISDMVSMSWEDYIGLSGDNNRCRHVYILGLDHVEPMEIPTDTEYPGVYSWSPDGKLLIYKNDFQSFNILNLETGAVRELPPIEPPVEASTDILFEIGVGNGSSPPVDAFSWSPSDHRIAVTGLLSIDKGGDEYWATESHIYILDLEDSTASPLIQK